MRFWRILISAVLLLPASTLWAADLLPLSVGVAGHAFDHLGNIAEQAPAAAASGATILYSTGLGDLGYMGLPKPAQLAEARDHTMTYLHDASGRGIRLAIGYVCATSIVKLDQFDRNWTPEFRARFKTPPAQWLQRDRDGKPLASWYGGDYRPACMNNPDWRTYEKEIVRLQLEAGHDGIFFDNPTVHPQGCYCDDCMKKFAGFLREADPKADLPAATDAKSLRQLAIDRPHDFLRFRTTIVADFLAEIRTSARSIKPGALITCNNSLNTPDAFFSQCRTYAYDIDQMSKVEDLVVVEDMVSQPRVLPDGSAVTYGPVYDLLRAISHAKPVVAITLAESDYHTPPNLTRLAMAEAAAHGASYLSWPTWPENVRQNMIASIRPEADLLRESALSLNDAQKRADVLLFLPFQRWQETTDCRALDLARALDAANVQFDVASESSLSAKLNANPRPVLIVESLSVLEPAEAKLVDEFKSGGGKLIDGQGKDWLATLQRIAPRSAEINHGPPTLRVVVWDQPSRTIVHLLNLNIQRLSSFEDHVNAANDARLRVRVPFANVHSVTAVSADAQATRGSIPFTANQDASGATVQIQLPKVELSTILSIE